MHKLQNKMNKIHDEKINSIKIRSKCKWYENSKKSSKS